jgi:hypothetical protein
MKKSTLLAIITLLFIVCMSVIVLSGCTEGQKRELKNIQSDWGGGIERTAVLMDYNGDTIKTWHGKFDIRDSGSDNQIFFDLDGKRVWIQGGIFVSEEN